MDVMAGAGGGMMGQLAGGIAGVGPGAATNFDSSAMAKIAKTGGVKPTIDSLPDKVRIIRLYSNLLNNRACTLIYF